MQTDVWNVYTDRSLQQFRHFSPLPCPICWLLSSLGPWETRSSSRSAWLSCSSGLACLFIATPIKLWFRSISSEPFLSEVFHSPKKLCSNLACRGPRHRTHPVTSILATANSPAERAEITLPAAERAPDFHPSHVIGCELGACSSPAALVADHKWLNPQHKQGLTLKTHLPIPSQLPTRSSRRITSPCSHDCGVGIKGLSWKNIKLFSFFFFQNSGHKYLSFTVLSCLRKKKINSHRKFLTFKQLQACVGKGSSSCTSLCFSLSHIFVINPYIYCW